MTDNSLLQNSKRDQSLQANQFYMDQVQENMCEVVSYQRYILNHNKNAQQSSMKKVKKCTLDFTRN